MTVRGVSTGPAVDLRGDLATHACPTNRFNCLLAPECLPGAVECSQNLKETIMVVIRLARGGAKKRPFFNIVVADCAHPPRRPLHRTRGLLQPRGVPWRAAACAWPSTASSYWVGTGAQLSPHGRPPGGASPRLRPDAWTRPCPTCPSVARQAPDGALRPGRTTRSRSARARRLGHQGLDQGPQPFRRPIPRRCWMPPAGMVHETARRRPRSGARRMSRRSPRCSRVVFVPRARATAIVAQVRRRRRTATAPRRCKGAPPLRLAQRVPGHRATGRVLLGRPDRPRASSTATAVTHGRGGRPDRHRPAQRAALRARPNPKPTPMPRRAPHPVRGGLRRRREHGRRAASRSTGVSTF